MPTIGDFLAEPDPPTLWYLDPYVASESITFIHGKTSLGKSPLTWEMARCISLGVPFLGWQTTRAPVLYVEADTPGSVLRPRLRSLPEPRGDWWIECIQEWGLDLASPGRGGVERLRWLYETCQPRVVFWNTLRSLTRGDLSKGETVQGVYSVLRQTFPRSAHVLVHHDRKESRIQDASTPDEDHSGSNAWRDTAQIVLHLRLRGSGTEERKSYLTLEHTKTQASPKMSPMRLELAEDGTRWLRDSRLEKIIEMTASLAAQSHTVKSIETEVCRELSISRATYFRLRAQSHNPPVSPT